MKSSIEVKRIDIIELNVDAIVNAANSQLQEGGGVCGAIFREAGSAELAEACYEIGICETDDAIITPGFNLPAKYIIPAVYRSRLVLVKNILLHKNLFHP